ncbi:MAG: hypothetical protein K2P81_17295 [Bacteriovoracaceae bacterium]|nr:hypothetical protein [Bacteriovoracaceae bacterium]
MYTLTSVERVVLESIGSRPRDIYELMSDTRLELKFLANILHAMILRGYIIHSDEGYCVNPHLPKNELEMINNPQSCKAEALELIEGMMNHEKPNIGIRKAWISEKDKKILNAMFTNIEQFVRTLPNPPKDVPLHDYTLIVWGQNGYGEAIKRVIGEIQ